MKADHINRTYDESDMVTMAPPFPEDFNLLWSKGLPRFTVAATTSCLIAFNLFLPFVDHFPASLQLWGHKLPEMSVIDEKINESTGARKTE